MNGLERPYPYRVLRKSNGVHAVEFPDRGIWAAVFGAGKVQGARLGKNGNCLLVEGAKRFKLYTEQTDLLRILEGNGHFKWKQGETDFRPGDCFEAEKLGEYEVNGSEKFLVVRK